MTQMMSMVEPAVARPAGGEPERATVTARSSAMARTLAPMAAVRLLARADADLAAAAMQSDPAERYIHAHLGALRAAAAVVAARGQIRGRARSVWDQLAEAEPTLAPWSAYFAAGARARAALDAGRFDAVDAQRADELLACAEDFRKEAAERIEPRTLLIAMPAALGRDRHWAKRAS